MALSQTEVGEDDDEEEGVSVYPPTDGGFLEWTWYIVTLPLVALLVLTIVNMKKKNPETGERQPAYRAYGAFLVCLAWMGLLSYYMVKWVEVIGEYRLYIRSSKLDVQMFIRS